MAELKRVKIGSIAPNPFRNLDEWPTVRDKVEELKASMEATGFWDGYMIVRKASKGHEQAFGHHRLVAMREL
jgi:ParB-like chromosome segregation protein Spo0J